MAIVSVAGLAATLARSVEGAWPVILWPGERTVGRVALVARYQARALMRASVVLEADVSRLRGRCNGGPATCVAACAQ